MKDASPSYGALRSPDTTNAFKQGESFKQNKEKLMKAPLVGSYPTRIHSNMFLNESDLEVNKIASGLENVVEQLEKPSLESSVINPSHSQSADGGGGNNEITLKEISEIQKQMSK